MEKRQLREEEDDHLLKTSIYIRDIKHKVKNTENLTITLILIKLSINNFYFWKKQNIWNKKIKNIFIKREHKIEKLYIITMDM